jgi:type II secretory pathway pseudopilin PulG
MTKPARRDSQGGFILIESIAVLLLGGLVLMTLLIATDLVTRNSNAAARRANTVEGLATGLSALRRDLSGARFTRGGGRPTDPLLFEGSPRSLAFAASGGSSEGQSDDLVRIETRFEEGRGLLMRSSARLRTDTVGFAGAAFSNPVILLSGPWTYRFSYGAYSVGPVQWRESWSAAKRLPDVVRLEILGGQDGRQVFTPLIDALHINAEAKCIASEANPCGASENGAPVDANVPPDDEGSGNGENDGQ